MNIKIIFIFNIFLYIHQLSKIISNKPDKWTVIYFSIIGYIVSGLISGMYHWFFDSYNTEIFKKFHNDFRGHHEDPLSLVNTPNLELFIECFVLGLPFLIAISLTNNIPFKIIIVSSFLTCGISQIIHKYSHIRNHENDKNISGEYLFPELNPFIKWAQDNHLILNPITHSKHHETELVNYCISHSNSDRRFEFIFIELFGLRTAIYMTNNNQYKHLNFNERGSLVQRTSFYDVINEQKYIIIISIIYFKFFMNKNN